MLYDYFWNNGGIFIYLFMVSFIQIFNRKLIEWFILAIWIILINLYKNWVRIIDLIFFNNRVYQLLKHKWSRPLKNMEKK